MWLGAMNKSECSGSGLELDCWVVCIRSPVSGDFGAVGLLICNTRKSALYSTTCEFHVFYNNRLFIIDFIHCYRKALISVYISLIKWKCLQSIDTMYSCTHGIQMWTAGPSAAHVILQLTPQWGNIFSENTPSTRWQNYLNGKTNPTK